MKTNIDFSIPFSVHSRISYSDSANSSKSRNRQDDLASCLRYLLIFGRIIGVIPYSGVVGGKTENLRFRWRYFATVVNVYFSFLMAGNAAIGGIGFLKKNDAHALTMATNIMYCFLYSVSLSVYICFLLNANGFFAALSAWKNMKFNYYTKDINLSRYVNLIVACIFISITGENISWYFKHAMHIAQDLACRPVGNSTETIDVIELFYLTSAPMVPSVLPYHPALMATIFLTNKLGLHAREFGDIFLIVVSRAICMRFKLLIQTAQKDLGIDKSTFKWESLIDDYNTMLNTCSLFAKFLSPLVFLSFCLNVYYISIRLCVTLQPTENVTFIDKLFSNWSFLHGIVRCYAVLLSTAKINEYALAIRSLLKKCPQELYSAKIQRFEYQLNNNEIGLHGFGCFLITKSLMLKLIGVIFTIEIVLLQSLTVVNSNNNKDSK